MKFDSVHDELMYGIREACRILKQKISDEIPETGKFIRQDVTFWIRNTHNFGGMIFAYDPYLGSDHRMLSLKCFRNGSSYEMTVRIFRGTNQETLKFLDLSKEQQSEYADTILQLSDDIDERYD